MNELGESRAKDRSSIELRLRGAARHTMLWSFSEVALSLPGKNARIVLYVVRIDCVHLPVVIVSERPMYIP